MPYFPHFSSTALCGARPRMRIVALSSQPEEYVLGRQSGADEIVCKTKMSETLLEKIEPGGLFLDKITTPRLPLVTCRRCSDLLYWKTTNQS